MALNRGALRVSVGPRSWGAAPQTPNYSQVPLFPQQ